MKLMNTTKNIELVKNLQKAESFFARLRGLLGRHSLSNEEALWIENAPSIHTFFMKFAIDVVFLDSNQRVRAQYENVRPWRVIFPVLGARSVVEFSTGAIHRGQIEVGDQLNVVH